MQDLIDNDILNTNRTCNVPYWPWLSLIQVGYMEDLIDDDLP
jgi:hypothetical protein